MQVGPSWNLLHPTKKAGHAGIENHRHILKGLLAGDPTIVRAGIEKDISDGASRLIQVLTTEEATL
jgi:hypothetical protein